MVSPYDFLSGTVTVAGVGTYNTHMQPVGTWWTSDIVSLSTGTWTLSASVPTGYHFKSVTQYGDVCFWGWFANPNYGYGTCDSHTPQWDTNHIGFETANSQTTRVHLDSVLNYNPFSFPAAFIWVYVEPDAGVTSLPPPASHIITVNTNPSGLDNPQGGGTYSAGTTITISIGSVNGYTFQKWLRDGVDYSTQMSFQYTVDGTHTFTAVLQPNPSGKYTLVLQVSPLGAGATAPITAGSPGQYEAGTKLQLSTLAYQGYTFLSWSGSGSGSYSGAGYKYGQPDPNGWFSSCSAGEVCADVQMNSDVTETAIFTTINNSYTINVNTSPSGLASPVGGGRYTGGASITISVGSVTDYTFQKWLRDGTDYSTQQTFQYTVDTNHTFTAVFQSTQLSLNEKPTMLVYLSIIGGGNPQSPIFNYMSNGQQKSYTLQPETLSQFNADYGTTWSITPNPLAGSSSTERWYSSQQLSGTVEQAFLGPTNRIIYFQHQYYLTVQANPTSGGLVMPPSGWQNAGITINIDVTPTTGYTFSGWTGMGLGSYTGNMKASFVTMNGAITETAALTASTGTIPQTSDEQSNYGMWFYNLPPIRGEVKVWVQDTPITSDITSAIQYAQNSLAQWNQEYPSYQVNVHYTVHVQQPGEETPPDPEHNVTAAQNFVKAHPSYDIFIIASKASACATGEAWLNLPIIEMTYSDVPQCQGIGYSITLHELGHQVFRLGDLYNGPGPGTWLQTHPMINGEIMQGTPSYQSYSTLDFYSAWKQETLYKQYGSSMPSGTSNPIYLLNSISYKWYCSSNQLTPGNLTGQTGCPLPPTLLWAMCPNPRQPCN